MTDKVRHLAGHTWHGRKGRVANSFRYSIDYVLIDAEARSQFPWLFGRNRFGLCSLYDRDYGGDPLSGRGVLWVRDVIDQRGLPRPERIMLLAQPRFWHYVYNPVSFWLCHNAAGEVVTVIAEVTNTFGERHSYLCGHKDCRPINAGDKLYAEKIHYVSPFQQLAGQYEFRFDFRDDYIGIWIGFSDDEDGGVTATLTGQLVDLSNASILQAIVRRPLGSGRVRALIYWQALKLWWKGEKYRMRPVPPSHDIS